MSHCSTCHWLIPTDAPIPICLPCHLEPPKEIFGDYVLLKKLGKGGMAEVWKARRRGGNDEIVALKRVPEDANEDEKKRFCEERTILQKLKELKPPHPHIVPLLDYGEHKGRPYFTMKLMWHGSLAEHRERFRGDPIRAATLMRKVAKATQCAHDCGILHRDLKPSNILLDDHDEPYVADFGVAKRMDREDKLTQTRAGWGTPGYMAPELAYKRSESLTEAADIYSLGVILCELTTPPKDSNANERYVDPDLATIYRTCLDHEPERRYASAQEMARDLRLYLQGQRVRWIERVWRWCRRHRIATGMLVAAFAFLVILTSSVISLMREHEFIKRAQIRQVNMNSASMVAGTMVSQLRALSDAVERMALKDELIVGLQSADPVAITAFCKNAFDFYEDPSHGLKLNENSPFQMWAVYDAKGIMQALAGKEPATVTGKQYEWREYFTGAMKLAAKGEHRSYISPAFLSENDGSYRFVLSAPIYANNRQVLGVLMAAVPTAKTLGSLVVHDPQSIIALAGPRGRDRQAPLPVSSHVLLLHPAYTPGEAVPIDNRQVRQLDEVSRDDTKRIEHPLGLPPPDLVMSSDDYEDPVGKGNADPKLGTVKLPNAGYTGRFLAGFAPVGNTGFVVIVQTRAGEAIDGEIMLGTRLIKWTGVAAVVSMLLAFVSAMFGRPRRIVRQT